jgi:hypothetical protein
MGIPNRRLARGKYPFCGLSRLLSFKYGFEVACLITSIFPVP